MTWSPARQGSSGEAGKACALLSFGWRIDARAHGPDRPWHEREAETDEGMNLALRPGHALACRPEKGLPFLLRQTPRAYSGVGLRSGCRLAAFRSHLRRCDSAADALPGGWRPVRPGPAVRQRRVAATGPGGARRGRKPAIHRRRCRPPRPASSHRRGSHGRPRPAPSPCGVRDQAARRSSAGLRPTRPSSRYRLASKDPPWARPNRPSRVPRWWRASGTNPRQPGSRGSRYRPARRG